MSNQFNLCDSCVQRNCKKSPQLVQGRVVHNWKCAKYRKHQTGFKMEEVMHGTEIEVLKMLGRDSK